MAENATVSPPSTKIDPQTQNSISSIPQQQQSSSPSLSQQLPAINSLNPNPNVFTFQLQPQQQLAGLYGGQMNCGGLAPVSAQQQQLAGGVGVGGNASSMSGTGAAQFNLLTSPGQKVGLVQSSQVSSGNSAGQSLQGMQQAIGTMGSSNLASQLMTTNRPLYAQQMQQLAQQASLNNQPAQQQQLVGGVGVGIGGGAFSFGGSAAVSAQQQQLAGGVGVGIGGNASSLSQSALIGQSGHFPILSGAGAKQSNLFTLPGQKVGLVQPSQFSSVNSAGQSLQGMQQAIGTMGSSNLASQLMTTNGAQQQLSQQASLNNQQLSGLSQNGQSTIQNQLLKQMPAISGTASLLPLQQHQRQQQLASSAQLQQNSLTLNQQQMPQLMQQQKSMGQPQLQQQIQQQQLQQQQQQYQRLQQQLASSAQLQLNSLTLNQQQLPQLMQQQKYMGPPLLQQHLQQQLLQQQQQQQQLLQQQQQQQQQQLLQQQQQLQQLASSAQLQQNSLTLNQQQLPQLMQQQKSTGQPLLQLQLQQQLLLKQQQLLLQQQQQQRIQLLQQQLQALSMPGPTGQKSLSLTGSQPDATAFGMTTPGGSSSQGTRTDAMSGQTEIMSIVRELKETRKEVKAVIKILPRFFIVLSIAMALFIFSTLFVVLIK